MKKKNTKIANKTIEILQNQAQNSVTVNCIEIYTGAIKMKANIAIKHDWNMTYQREGENLQPNNWHKEMVMKSWKKYEGSATLIMHRNGEDNLRRYKQHKNQITEVNKLEKLVITQHPKKIATKLVSQNTRKPYLYLLPKIQKPKNLERPLTWSSSGHRKKIDNNIKPNAECFSSYIEDDAGHFNENVKI